MYRALALAALLSLILVVAHGFRPVIGPAWYLGGAGIPVAVFVIAVLLKWFR